MASRLPRSALPLPSEAEHRAACGLEGQWLCHREFESNGPPTTKRVFAWMAILVVCTLATGADSREECGGRRSDGAVMEQPVWATGSGRFPYLVTIRRAGSRDHVCSGVLIASTWVLTAAHCVDPTSPYAAGKKPFVHIGARNVTDSGKHVEVHIVERSELHAKWVAGQQSSAFNLALLKLPRRSTYAVPKMLQDHFSLNTGQTLWAAGWGAGSSGPALGEEIFASQSIESQEFIDSRRCGAALWKNEVGEGIFCALNSKREASCIVDSGSPLLLLDMPRYEIEKGSPDLDFLVGLNVDGAPCGEYGKPDLYVDIRGHKEWIESHIEEGRQLHQEL